MLSDKDRDYLARREEYERRLAAAAADPGVRKIHLELAQRYAAKLGQSPQAPMNADTI